MNPTRRIFGKWIGIALMALATGGSTLMTGCGVFTDILLWIPIGTSAINGIVNVLGGLIPAPALAIINLVLAALANLAATITQYNNDTNPADKATLLAKIRTILNDVVTNFQSFLNQLNLGSNPIEAIVVGLAQVVLAALAGFLGQLPATSGKTLSTTFRIGNGRLIAYTPKFYKTTKPFISDYNAVADSHGHPEIDLH